MPSFSIISFIMRFAAVATVTKIAADAHYSIPGTVLAVGAVAVLFVTPHWLLCRELTKMLVEAIIRLQAKDSGSNEV